uniref:Uncharacterized protein n=1 Tax=Rhizophora mucronata TaxID=61149 RepID=A0A2P2QKE1_RHIMU
MQRLVNSETFKSLHHKQAQTRKFIVINRTCRYLIFNHSQLRTGNILSLMEN